MKRFTSFIGFSRVIIRAGSAEDKVSRSLETTSPSNSILYEVNRVFSSFSITLMRNLRIFSSSKTVDQRKSVWEQGFHGSWLSGWSQRFQNQIRQFWSVQRILNHCWRSVWSFTLRNYRQSYALALFLILLGIWWRKTNIHCDTICICDSCEAF